MRRLVEPWTPLADESIKAFAAQGASVMRAAAALGRTKSSVRERAKKLGCPLPSDRDARKKWTDKPKQHVWRGY
jgi:GcrA cell cycle regulator